MDVERCLAATGWSGANKSWILSTSGIESCLAIQSRLHFLLLQLLFFYLYHYLLTHSSTAAAAATASSMVAW